MKPIFYLALLFALGTHTSHSATTAVNQLKIQKSEALPAHLTTRISWTQFPQPQYTAQDLDGQNRTAIIRIHADETGQITKATTQESSGLAALDQILLTAVRHAKVNPPIQNEVPVAMIGYQTFQLRLPDEHEENCNLSFQSQNWLAQNRAEKTAFQYQQQPSITLTRDDLKNHDRSIAFKFKVGRAGQVKKVDIIQGSGNYDLDQKVRQAILNSQIHVKRSISTLWLYKKSTFKDYITFKHC
ncbi:MULTISPECIES: TonB family protein [unclassified Acinetobacter]|uniref:TonB family protein n=1 Tax=unclassified Acinetobacter TaxID=196816 RepID=UPI002934E072|nr:MULTISPECIES: TonB family protein [unclassified Acinetobacter]WOE30403.1 TonB family protein [Acinetobacter sp. SAAs470]WOE38594.1 TonB family protein [Acinetobacter sp. SAAs474]